MKALLIIPMLTFLYLSADNISLPLVGVETTHVNEDFEEKTYTIQREVDGVCFSIPIDEDSLWGGNFANDDVPEKCKKTFVTVKGMIQPMDILSGVKTVGELEVLAFIQNKVNFNPSKYLLIDSRTNGWFEQNTIPGAVNVPYTDLEYDEMFEEYYFRALETLGINIKADKSYDFSNVKEIMMFCNGAWCAQSPNAIKHLVSIGYPAKKIKWYRGGMTSWLSLGLTTTGKKK